MNKSITKIIIKNQVRVYLSNYKIIAQEIINKHNYPPFPSLILANAICAFTPLKFLYDTLNLMTRLRTNGPISSLIVEVKNNNVRALVANPNIETEYDLNKINEVPLILGVGDAGTLQISRIVNNETFTSDVNIARGDIISDVAYYLNKSDQIFSAVLNDVQLDKNNKVLKANNVIFQLLPNHDENDISWIESFINNHDFKKINIDQYEKLINGQLLEIKEIDANCWCNKNKIINAINNLSINEKENLFENDENIETKCDFCNNKFIINKKEV